MDIFLSYDLSSACEIKKDLLTTSIKQRYFSVTSVTNFYTRVVVNYIKGDTVGRMEFYEEIECVGKKVHASWKTICGEKE